MPSRCFIQTEASLDPACIERDLIDINHNRFHDLFKIETHQITGEICDWIVIFDNIYNFPICLRTHNKLEFAHPDNYFSLWIQLVCEDELAAKYNARMMDEEYPKCQLQPDPQHHITFRTFLETIMAHHSPQWKRALIELELSYLPNELKDL